MKKMQTYKKLLDDGIAILESSAIEEARLDAWLLLEYTADINRAWYYVHMGEAVSDNIADKYIESCKKRSERIPLQHITGQAYFMGYEFFVDERVLVPRQDTEVLVEEALGRLEGIKSPRILDMCTGSGCILLSVLSERNDASGVGADISEDALEVAAINRKRLRLDDRAELVQSDLFSDDYFHKKYGNTLLEYDMLISNPPYIPTADIDDLMDEVRLHDPAIALDGKDDGLFFYRRITKEAKDYLKPGGWLMYEIGCDQGKDVSLIMDKNGFTQIQIIKDLAGLDRVVIGRRPTQEEYNV